MEHIRQTIQTLIDKIEKQERELAATKLTVNLLLKELGEQPKYNLETEQSEATACHGKWRSDEFYGQSLAGAVKRILLARKAVSLGAASVNEIFDALKSGGYEFGSTDEINAKTVLRQNLRKNSAVFHRITSTGAYGLKEWYPHAKPERKTSDDASEKPETEQEAGPEQVEFVAPASGPSERVVSKPKQHNRIKDSLVETP